MPRSPLKNLQVRPLFVLYVAGLQQAVCFQNLQLQLELLGQECLGPLRKSLTRGRFPELQGSSMRRGFLKAPKPEDLLVVPPRSARRLPCQEALNPLRVALFSLRHRCPHPNQPPRLPQSLATNPRTAGA